MNLAFTSAPYWVSLLFIPTYSLFFILIGNAIQKGLEAAGDSSLGKKVKSSTFLFYFLWIGVVSFFSLTGFFQLNTLPPRILVFTAGPLFVFYLLYITNRAWFKAALKNVAVDDLVLIHSFRLVGVFFLINYYYGVLPRDFALVAGIGDIITAILALLYVFGINKKSPIAVPFLWFFNCFGLIDILSVIATALITTQAAIVSGTPGLNQIGTFPFSWIPATAPATIIFLHILIFIKLIRKAV